MNTHTSDMPIIGQFPGIVWPPVSGVSRTLLDILEEQIKAMEWVSGDEILLLQRKQLARLCHHARESTPFYKERLSGLNIDFNKGIDLTEFQKLPLLKREDLQNQFEDLQSADLSLERGPTMENISSGSTGEPVKTTMSFYLNDLNCVLQKRWYDWNKMDGNKAMSYFTSKFFKPGDPANKHTKGWYYEYPNGDYFINNVGTSMIDKIKWLEENRPSYLVTYPSYTDELLRYAIEHGSDLSFIELILNYAEPIMPNNQIMADRVCGAKIVNKYASRETGCIALECPESGMLHVQSENVFLEIIKEDGTLAKPGEAGKVVVTSLTNTAMPLIRYELGDMAEMGGECSCGRKHMTIANILGRSRHLFRVRGGDRLRPITNLRDREAFSYVRKLQYVQYSYDDIALRYVSDEPLPEDIEKRMIIAGEEMVPGYDFNIILERVDDLPRNAGGKFDDILCEISDEE